MMGLNPDVPVNPVASGSYIVSNGKNEIVNAYLGTCVGVSICDRKAKVGGLIHLLLPEPAGPDMSNNPENYALTGMPLFIQALCKQGARIERMEACIAGGALVGPLSELDLTLDIGGRTVEIVEQTLRTGGIPVLKRETGGYFSCCLSLNLKTWESQIRPINHVTSLAEKDYVKPTPEQLENTINSVRPVPQVALKILRLIRDDTKSMQDLAGEIRQDQVISARVIRLCNSAYFRLKTEVGSIDRALIVLGQKRLVQVVLSAAFEEFLSQSKQGYSLCKGGLFNHAIGTAMIGEKLAEFTGKAPSDIAYTAGLMHDIGKVVLDQFIDHTYALFYRRVHEDGNNLIAVEREIIGVSHEEIGFRLAEKWALPGNLAEVIHYHHRPQEAIVDPDLTNIIYLADLLMSRFVVGQELDRLDTQELSASLKRAGIERKDFPSLIEKIPSQLFILPFNGGYSVEMN